MTTYEKLKRLRQEFQQFVLVDAKSLPEREMFWLRDAFDTVAEVESRIRARQIEEERELERRALALATPAPEPEPEQVSTFGVKGCPE